MAHRSKEEIAAFTKSVVKAIGTSAKGKSMREIVEKLGVENDMMPKIRAALATLREANQVHDNGEMLRNLRYIRTK